MMSSICSDSSYLTAFESFDESCDPPISVSSPTSMSSSHSFALFPATKQEKTVEMKWHSPRLSFEQGPISQEDEQYIKQLRSLLKHELKECPDYDNDFSLLRWLYGYDYKFDTILPLFKKTVAFRKALKLHEIDYTKVTDLDAFLSERFSPALVEYFPGGITGTDKEGNILCLIPSGYFDIRGYFHSVRASEYILRAIVLTEGLMSLVRAQERRLGHKCGIFYLCDLDGFTLKEQMWMPPFPVTSFMMTMLQEHFPDMLHKMLVIRAPASIQVAYKMMYPFLSKQTREKIEFASGDWTTRLLELIDGDQLPKYWGGTQTHQGSVYGNVKLSVKLPLQLRYDPTSDPHEIDSSALEMLSVSRGSSSHVKIDCTKPGRILKWFFKLASGDITFAIYLLKDGQTERELVWPEMKLITDFVPEYGQLICENAGQYFLIFDNKHSLLRSKRVNYWVKLM